MRKADWKKKIIKVAKEKGVFLGVNDSLYSVLADAFAQYDAANKLYEEQGCAPVISQLNKAGEEYMTRNPLITTMEALRKQIFTCSIQLGILEDYRHENGKGKKQTEESRLLDIQKYMKGGKVG
ncbi:phage terminase small subunit [Moryella indoligenes]|uniref:Phage terminase small subunit n=1 Tax=Moryella indoligenes TaxID=371674 RepID=A0AAE3VC76_9FIRM|nr:P27 family phage terminase small subunit [Moryella indoligenes]MDQ0153589.1 phage terminase small subunit [Moryella indoligenes]